MKKIPALHSLSFACVALGIAAAVPARAATDLSVSSDGRYLIHDGKPFHWIGDTAWKLPEKLSRDDASFYLDDRRARGFTVIQAVIVMGGGGNPANAYGAQPFHGGEKPDPSRPLVVEGGSPDVPNDYWDHLDFLVRAARERGLHLALLPCWGGSFINGLSGAGKHVIFDVPKARAYGEFLGARYGREPHLIWMLGGDVGAMTGPRRSELDKRPEYRAMAEGLAKGATGRDAKWHEPDAAWRALFMTYHPFGGPPAESSSLWFHDDAWCDFHFVQTHRYLNQVHAAMLRDWQLARPKPTILAEPAYEGIFIQDGTAPSPRPKLGPVDALHMRRQIWQAWLGGSRGFTFGLDHDAATETSGALWDFVPTWKQLLGTPATLSVTEGMGKILLAHAWWKWRPDQSLIADDPGEKDLTFSAARADDARELLVYFPVNAAKKINLAALKSARARATWIHPQDAARTPGGDHATGDAVSFTPPRGWTDALLVVEPL